MDNRQQNWRKKGRLNSETSRPFQRVYIEGH